MKRNRTHDLIICGGGMVGATLAAALGDSPLRIAVIDLHKARQRWPRESWGIRTCALTRASQHILDNVGAWEGMVRRRVHPYSDMYVWDATGSGSVHFSAADVGEPNLGHIVENRVIQAALAKRLTELSNVELICPARIDALEFREERVEVALEGGRELSAALLVGADGRDSWVRRQAGITTHGWEYRQTAVITVARTERHHRDTAWQRFTTEGPLAFLPLAEGHSSIVWSVTPEHAEQLLEMEEGPFMEQLGQSFEHTLGRVEWIAERAAFPLRLQHASRYIRPRLVLAGDAAHAIHPLAGQGVNLGLADAATLAEVIAQAWSSRRDIGQPATLRRYERWRKSDNIPMMGAMDGFKRLFGSELTPLCWARNLGLTLTDVLPPIKRGFIRHAMGLTGHLPRLARTGGGVSLLPGR